MELVVVRKYKGPEYTIGNLYVNDEYFCDTLEDTDRGLDSLMSLPVIKSKKIYGLTAIPKGSYKIDMNTVSNKYSDYTKYPYAKEFNAKMPRILDVKGWDGVLIHPGNNKEHTLGCILVGENKKKGEVINSQTTWKKLMLVLLKDKDNITLTIK